MNKNEEWIPISDIMSGLSIIFMFIAIMFMRNITKQQEIINEKSKETDSLYNSIRIKYNKTHDIKTSIYNDLYSSLGENLIDWGANIDSSSLTITFNSVDVLFKQGSYELSKKFKDILNEFFPLYMNVLHKYKDNISEIRVEGHTSSEWSSNTTKTDAYFKNIKLSQDRTRSVLSYVFNNVMDMTPWMMRTITANGLSSSKIIKINGIENKVLSRRVCFVVVVNDEEIKNELEKQTSEKRLSK